MENQDDFKQEFDVFISVIRKDGEITTWKQILNKPLEEIINHVKKNKNWEGGKFEKIYIASNFGSKGYFKYWLDHSKLNKLLK